jgi:DNA mismatch repair protein MSH6
VGNSDVGAQELELRMTQRVNMRMAGVPESSFADWATKLVAKGFVFPLMNTNEMADIISLSLSLSLLN